MEQIIIYGSRYGSTRRYAEKLSELTGIPATDCSQIPDLSEITTVIYLGGLYAGGVLGLKSTLRAVCSPEKRNWIIITVGLADPKDPQNQQTLRTSLKKQLPPALFHQAAIFHLRGAIDYGRLSLGHRTMMALLYRSVRHLPLQQQSAENRAMIETYGRQVDFTDFRALKPIADQIQQHSTF